MVRQDKNSVSWCQMRLEAIRLTRWSHFKVVLYCTAIAILRILVPRSADGWYSGLHCVHKSRHDLNTHLFFEPRNRIMNGLCFYVEAVSLTFHRSNYPVYRQEDPLLYPDGRRGPKAVGKPGSNQFSCGFCVGPWIIQKQRRWGPTWPWKLFQGLEWGPGCTHSSKLQ